MKYSDSKVMAEEHVDWFLKIIRPIIVEHMVHGYKHGYEDGADSKILKK